MSTAVDRHAAMLARHGWYVFRRAAEPALLADIEADLETRFAATPLCEGAFYGEQTKRFGSLLTRSPTIERLAMHPLIIEIVEQMLLPWCERIALNLTQAIEIHSGALPQLPHRDQDTWQGPKGSLEFLVNVMWPLAPFTRENGGTRLWTGSHFDQDIALLPEEDAVVPSVAPGDALIFLGSTLHGGGGNLSAAPRRGIIISYCLGWLKPFELQWLVYPPQVARHFSPELASLVGYSQHRPNLGNVEGQCPSVLLAITFPTICPRSTRFGLTRPKQRRCSSDRRWTSWAEVRVVMMPDPAAYDAIARRGRSALAWEVLRRDPQYRAAFAELQTPPAPALAADRAFAARWGMHFR